MECPSDVPAQAVGTQQVVSPFCESGNKGTLTKATSQQDQSLEKQNLCTNPPNNTRQSWKTTAETLEGVRSSSRKMQTLSTSLQLLSNVNEEHLFIVRRIHKLGFKAGRVLKRYFSIFGTVVRVLVAHSTVRSDGDSHCYARRRPSSLGFIQMSSTTAVDKILQMGPELEIGGSVIRIQKFHRQHADEAAAEEQATTGKTCFDDESLWVRQTTVGSDPSLRSLSTASLSEVSDDDGDDEESCDLHN